MADTTYLGSKWLALRSLAPISSRPGRRASAAAVMVGAASVAFLLLSQRSAPAAAADGTYSHDCCGDLLIRDGRLILQDAKPVNFEVERDRTGQYLVPSIYVGTWEDRGFEIDGTRAPLKLRLNTGARLATIELPAMRGSRIFTRREP